MATKPPFAVMFFSFVWLNWGCGMYGTITRESSFSTQYIVNEINKELLSYYTDEEYQPEDYGMKCYSANNCIILFVGNGRAKPKSTTFKSVTYELLDLATGVLHKDCSKTKDVSAFLILSRNPYVAYFYSDSSDLEAFCSNGKSLPDGSRELSSEARSAAKVVYQARTFDLNFGRGFPRDREPHLKP